MTPALQNAAEILPGILRDAIPVSSGPGYYLHVEGAELDALRELNGKLATALYWERHARGETPANG